LESADRLPERRESKSRATPRARVLLESTRNAPGPHARPAREISMKTWATGATTVAVVCALAGVASAQQIEGSAPRPRGAPGAAVEIDVNTGYTQGFGGISARKGDSVSDVARGGVSVGLGLGYRATPELAVGVTGQYQELVPATAQPQGTRVRGAAVGLEGKVHFRPYERVDPWLSLGAGYRMLWVAPEGVGNNVLVHGFELARGQLGLDVRVSRDVALGPMIGGDVNLFVARNPEGPAGDAVIADKKLNTFVFAGVQGRFDVGGTRVLKTGTVQMGSR
jgi:hypothetical protein